MTPDDAPARLVPRVLLVVLPAAWAALIATLPVATGRDLTVDVSCASGNPAVGVWIESRSGGSAFAQEGGPEGMRAKRFVFRQDFSDHYQVRVGCGGTQQQWAITVVSTFNGTPYRRLVCDDTDIAAIADLASDGCTDQAVW